MAQKLAENPYRNGRFIVKAMFKKRQGKPLTLPLSDTQK
jgi:hypothetical protein